MRGKEVPSSKKPISKGLKALIDRKHSVRLIHYRQFPSLPRCRTEVFGWHCAHPAFPPTSSPVSPWPAAVLFSVARQLLWEGPRVKC